jgi:hypothetical protein
MRNGGGLTMRSNCGMFFKECVGHRRFQFIEEPPKILHEATKQDKEVNRGTRTHYAHR